MGRWKEKIWVDECLMSPNGLLCDPAVEDPHGLKVEGKVLLDGRYISGRKVSSVPFSEFTFVYFLISLSLTEQAEDQCLVMPNVRRLQSFILKSGSRYQSIADTNHCSTVNAEQRVGSERDRRMDGEREDSHS